MFTTLLRTFEKVHLPEEAFPPVGNATWRSMNMKTSAPIIIAIDSVPTDHAILDAVLCFILTDSDASQAGTETCRRDSIRWGRPPRPIGCQHPQNRWGPEPEGPDPR
jgi:hypothetical protein